MLCVYVPSMGDYIRQSCLQICNMSQVEQVPTHWEGTTVREFNPLNRVQPPAFAGAEILGRYLGCYDFHSEYMKDSCGERLWASRIQ